jgi:hypothetical protein
MGVSFKIAARPRQRSLSQVRDKWDTWPHFTLSDSRLPQTWGPGTRWPSYIPRHWVPFSSPPTTRRATVEVFEPASTGHSRYASQSQSQIYVTTDGQSASLSWLQAPIWVLRPDFYFCLTVAGLLMWGAPSDERTGLSFTMYNVHYIYILHDITWIYTVWKLSSRTEAITVILLMPSIGDERD